MTKSLLVLHIVAGALGIISGFISLYSTKGARLHRRVGMAFVITMLAMTLSALLLMAVMRVGPVVNVLAAVLTAYLVITGLVAIRPPARRAQLLDVGAMLVALVVGLTSSALAYRAITSTEGTLDGLPPFPYVMFGVVGILGSALDLRMIRAGGLRGTSRLARHLWRMCFALFIAAMSFFLGQADLIPEQLRIVPLLAFPPLAVLATMSYWLWRLRNRRWPPNVVSVRAGDSRRTPAAVRAPTGVGLTGAPGRTSASRGS